MDRQLPDQAWQAIMGALSCGASAVETEAHRRTLGALRLASMACRAVVEARVELITVRWRKGLSVAPLVRLLRRLERVPTLIVDHPPEASPLELAPALAATWSLNGVKVRPGRGAQ
jgi:hypothetical protein